MKKPLFDVPWPDVFYLPEWLSNDGWSICIHENMIYAADNPNDANTMVNTAQRINAEAGRKLDCGEPGKAQWRIRIMSRTELFDMLENDPPSVPIQYVVTRIVNGQFLLMDLTSRKRGSN